ncbi:hypothetical protein RD1_3656 [Roseobacter denitrificans OCh 114]|uniref:Uncharacterized protein n=1 Tax=Roseobacter denitrificans (strain ATCC 33942 / OCh 114) TaxID=375451 RepID=Q162G3_ROSDO|nr:hypothetical protein RD1_3656 [Roseobacter denitrificans OCh 114]
MLSDGCIVIEPRIRRKAACYQRLRASDEAPETSGIT